MRYLGMNAITGRAITDSEHIRQSIRDILLTPIGSRLARRTYGSLLSALIDSPLTPATQLQLMSACYTALLIWEPRINLNRLSITIPEAAKMVLDIEGVDSLTDSPVNLSVPLR
ncbi:GPW/gp25 family protein [Arsenophonus nasoniae]|uniref:GPW/gp25 family protein n=1 Tax=Arsenophonus nasoniae TaxID=638 RepID=A0AA95GAZ6_9GAMM|nr:GPW/gp25 family protein [Arsenophonus nasoniae]WGL95307.1 GPW/gp25 family protein [Arsenophonus nasoniae]